MTAALKPLALPNIIHLKNDYPAVHDDLVKMQEHINLVTQMLGGYANPQAAGGILVSASNGIIDVTIIDRHPVQGEEYFLNYDTSPSFANAHDVPLAAVRNYRTATLAGQTTYWRWYKSTKLGGLSQFMVYGNPPIAVTPGNVSTTTPGPVPAQTSGSGQSQIPGYGYSAPTSGPNGGGGRLNIL
jgi:hypothetical protein